MTTTLTFSLPEESEELKDALDGSNIKSVIWELDQFLRSKIKYSDLSDEQYATYNEIRDELYRILNEREVSI